MVYCKFKKYNSSLWLHAILIVEPNISCNTRIHHMDLYRLSGEDQGDFGPLNLDYVFKNCISLIEWPSRLGKLIPSQRLHINFRIDPKSDDNNDENTIFLTLTPYGEKWEKHLEKIQDDGYLDDLIIEYEDDEER